MPSLDGVKEGISDVFTFSTAKIMADIKDYVQADVTKWYDFVGTMFQSMIDLILYTPKALIFNPQVQSLWLIFISITVGLLGVMCIVEGIRTVLGQSNVNFLQFLGRTVTAFAGIAVILPGMTMGLGFVNQFVKYFTNMAFGHVGAGDFLGRSLADTLGSGYGGMLASLVFLALFIYYMFRILLNYGRRWFDIMMSAIISPLAIGATIFDSTAHYFKMWWSHVVQLYLVQIVHAIYVTVLALVVLTPVALGGAIPGFMKILIIIGALWRMSTPPRFVSSMAGSPDSRDMLKDISRKFIKMKTLGKFGKGGK